MTTAIAEYSPTEAKLVELRQTYGATVWVLESRQQLEIAKKARAEIRKWRVDLEAERKRIKEPALNRCKEIDTEAKRITAELLKLEEPVDHAIKEVEAKQESERQAKARAEQERVDKARAEIEWIREPARRLVGASSDEISDALTNLGALVVARTDEFSDTAVVAKTETMAALVQLYNAAKAQEAEQARAEQERKDAEERIAAERAELARLRAEQEAREDESRARIAEQERVARIAREKADEEARQLRLAEQARLDVERQKIEAARREAEEKARKEREALDAIERERKRKATERMDAREMLKTFAERYDHLAEFEKVLAAISDYFAELEKKAA